MNKEIDYKVIYKNHLEALKTFKEGKEFKKVTLEDGIYLDMPEGLYHLLNYHSNSANKDIVIDPEGLEYWHKNQWLNKDFKLEEKKEAYEFGKAFHCMVLEPKRFDEEYVVQKSKDDFGDKRVLNTLEDLKTFAKDNDLPVSGTKQVLIDRVVDFLDDNTVIYQLYLESFELESVGKIILTKKDKERLEGMREALEYQGECTNIIDTCYKEVTIIWTEYSEEGSIKCKARLDGLNPYGILDPKTFSTKGNTINEAIQKTIRLDRYNNQYYVYNRALKLVIEKIKNGDAKVYGEINEKFLNELLKQESFSFFFLYARSEAPYQTRLVKMISSEFACGEVNNYYSSSLQEWEAGLRILTNCLNTYPKGEKWRQVIKTANQMTDEKVGFQVPRI